ncbi:MAG: hypothetical protein JNK30_11855 [Phenylobacterium sp.]|uniref:hypothetical protein n=1 Tax=Phenylobacterium sp. TaxID=1871053 RepID=UPI001A366965|nr:hypothetical protein [Phenylobacterium sp.]MBL8772066.1 hypothetical protein [Phenylobacterium sp.]
MTAIDRRRWIFGAGAALLASSAGAAEARAMYDYLFLDFESEPGEPPAKAYVEQVRARLPAIQAAGGEVLGLFTPQLGWVARQAALLVRWTPEARTRDAEIRALMRGKALRQAQRGKLEATLRPAPEDRPKGRGIYVHRWFVVKTADVPEFLELSSQGWTDFEKRFDTTIFGLFSAERTSRDIAGGVQRLLLITRYGDHGVWEASRDPSTEAMAAFRRRQLLTRDTWAASTLLSPIAT